MNSSHYRKPRHFGRAEISKLSKSQYTREVSTYPRNSIVGKDKVILDPELLKKVIEELRERWGLLESRDLQPDDILLTLGDWPALPAEVEEQAAREAQAISRGLSQELMSYLQRNPEKIYELPGHLFEELLAEILASFGFDEISLRVPTEAGEVDILGFSKDILGHRIGYVFELKQRGQSKKLIEVREITRLYGLRESLRTSLGVDQGVFVTTTDYTEPARQFAAIHRLSLKGFAEVTDWLRSYEESPSGLFLRGTVVQGVEFV